MLKTVLCRSREGLFFHGPPLDLVMRTLIGASAIWYPSGRPFWTLDTQPTEAERDELWVQSVQGSLWDFGLLQPLYDEIATLPNVLIVEVGANIGTGAIYAGSLGARVLAVEAGATAYELLLRNIAANPSVEGRVFPLRYAAYDSIGRFASIAAEDNGNLGALALEPVVGDGLIGGPLDTFVPMFALGCRVALVKTDVQGCDGRVLLGLRETLREYHPVVCFEWEEELARRHGISLSKVMAFLEGMDYVIHESSAVPGNYVALPGVVA